MNYHKSFPEMIRIHNKYQKILFILINYVLLRHCLKESTKQCLYLYIKMQISHQERNAPLPCHNTIGR